MAISQRRYDELMSGSRFADAREHFRRACFASKLHGASVDQALALYGDHGPQVSGIWRDHFPEDVKDHLRALAREVTTEGDAARAARPKRVRMETMRLLASLVAEQYGHGFYGPQPRRGR